jgi:hypothetical protein
VLITAGFVLAAGALSLAELGVDAPGFSSSSPDPAAAGGESSEIDGSTEDPSASGRPLDDVLLQRLRLRIPVGVPERLHADSEGSPVGHPPRLRRADGPVGLRLRPDRRPHAVGGAPEARTVSDGDVHPLPVVVLLGA